MGCKQGWWSARWKKLKWKKQIGCVAMGVILGAAAQVQSGAGQGFGQDYVLKRNGYGQGEAFYQINVEGLEEETVSLDIKLSERIYTKEEAHKAYEAVMEDLPRYILGDNESLTEVRTSLNLVTSLNQYGIRLRWESDNPELVDSFGQVNNRGVEESGHEVCLSVRMTDGTWPEEFIIPVMVKPPLLTEEQIQQDHFLKMLSMEDERQRSTEIMKLPESFQGRELRYHMKDDPVFLPLAGLGAVFAVLLTLKDQSDIKKGENKRKHQLLLDYSEVLSRLIIFLGAGMSIRTAWDKVAFGYQKLVDDGKQKPRYAYQEMYETSCQMRGGVPEGRAFMDFGRRCGLQQYMKLSSLLEQNRKNGSKNLRDTLKVEMAEAFEQRKHQARRLGEEAGTKLLLPLFMMLSVVMVVIAVPALMEFG